jgi:hypothetical protein
LGTTSLLGPAAWWSPWGGSERASLGAKGTPEARAREVGRRLIREVLRRAMVRRRQGRQEGGDKRKKR